MISELCEKQTQPVTALSSLEAQVVRPCGKKMAQSPSVTALELDLRALLVRLEPDVAKAFPTAEAVNEGLRSLMRTSETQQRKAS